METWIRVLFLAAFLFPAVVECRVRHYKFNVVMRNTTRLCSTKPIVTVNGQFPGPTVYAREGDNVLIKVVNHVKYNVSIHWHGIRQLRTGWADGPAFITQCPIQQGQTYTYNFTITGQRGTLLWHAHILWLRATVYGGLVILPKRGVPYPFPKPHKEAVVILGEWWKSDTEAVINEALKSGLAPNVSDAHTINGHPGPISNCPSQGGGGFTLSVQSGKTYMLRVINAGLNEELFFKIAGHQLKVVEVDATYVKPFKIDTIVIAPGQTTNVILTADRNAGNPPVAFNYTGTPPASLATNNGTKVYPLQYNATVQLVLQDTGIIAAENHPVHLHGFNFFAIGKGLGNYNPKTDPKKFNLVDPVERNTIGVPAGGWVAIRFRADNPGVWFMHCHLEVHTSWGLKMAFLVHNGKGPNESILPPPKDLPKC